MTGRSPHPWSTARVLSVMLAAFSAGAAGIHGSVITEHARESLVYALFFAGAAGLQLLWAYLVLAHPSRLVWGIGALGSTSIIMLWVATRTVGVPVGPEVGTVEAAGTADIVATALEVGIAVGCLLLLAPRVLRRLEDRAVAYVVIAGIALVGGVAASAAMIGEGGAHEVTATSASTGPFAAHAVHLALVVVAALGYGAYRSLQRLGSARAQGAEASVPSLTGSAALKPVSGSPRRPAMRGAIWPRGSGG